MGRGDGQSQEDLPRVPLRVDVVVPQRRHDHEPYQAQHHTLPVPNNTGLFSRLSIPTYRTEAIVSLPPLPPGSNLKKIIFV